MAEGDATRSTTVITTSGDTTNTQAYSTFTYDFVAQGTKSGIRDAHACSVNIDAPISVPSDYNRIADYYLVGGANQPTFADVNTELRYSGIVQASTTDAYGIDITFQEAVVSPDWDYLPVGSSSGSSGDEGGDGTWGLVSGNILSQVDLQDQFATYEPIINNKNTAFNLPLGVTGGTVCEGNDSRLSDARTPTTHNHDERYYTETEVNQLLLGNIKTVSDTAPAIPNEGEEWYDAITGSTYTWYSQGSGQWVKED